MRNKGRNLPVQNEDYRAHEHKLTGTHGSTAGRTSQRRDHRQPRIIDVGD